MIEETTVGLAVSIASHCCSYTGTAAPCSPGVPNRPRNSIAPSTRVWSSLGGSGTQTFS
ncbi:MAG: hypothetical protein WKF83_09735 [Nocardioidaceae bacterium]